MSKSIEEIKKEFHEQFPRLLQYEGNGGFVDVQEDVWQFIETQIEQVRQEEEVNTLNRVVTYMKHGNNALIKYLENVFTRAELRESLKSDSLSKDGERTTAK